MIKTAFKKLLFSLAPQSTTAIMSASARATAHGWLMENGIPKLTQKLVCALGDRVLTGPFAGMILTEMTRKENLGPFLLGTYESELHPWLKSTSQHKFSQILDVGSRFGYYAVGLSKMHPQARCIAFDTDWWARKATREMLSANGASSCEIRGFCSPEWIDAHLASGALIVSDCEGYEGELLCRSKAPKLDTAMLIVETHEAITPGVTNALVARFSKSHSVEVVSSCEKPPPSGVYLGFLTAEEIRAATCELRPQQDWLLFTPRLNM